jgi:hypothetical protein
MVLPELAATTLIDHTMVNMQESWRGKVGTLNQDELSQFLAEGRIARVACVDDEGWPYVVPTWHEWDGTGFWVVARKKSAWARYLQQRPQCALSVDEEGGQRKVIAQCLAHVIEEPNVGGKWVPIAERMATRYLGLNGPKYLVPTLDRPRWLLYLGPRSVWTWQGNDWARRYKE